MAKSKSARIAQSAVAKFDLAAWSADLAAAALNVESGAKQLLDLALTARGKRRIRMGRGVGHTRASWLIIPL